MKLVILFISASLAWGATLSVCVTGTCPATNNYTTINEAIRHLNAPGDVIELYPGQGNSDGSNGIPVGAYCGGDGNCTTNNPIYLRFNPAASTSSRFVLTTHQHAKLPKAGTRITPEYADGASPVTALVWNVGSGPLMFSDYGVIGCALSVSNPVATGVTYTANVVPAPDNSFYVGAGQITEDNTTGEHKIALGFTSSSNTFQATVVFAPDFATTLSQWIVGADANTAQVASGAGIANGDKIQLDQEIMQVTGGGGSQSLSIARGQQSTTAQGSHRKSVGVINLTTARHQAWVRLGGYTCIVDFTAPGTVVSTTSASTCNVVNWGYTGGANGVNHKNWWYVTITLPPGTISDHTIYAGIASGGTTSYGGNGAGHIFVYRPSVVDQQTVDGYRCPAYGYSIEGLELNGGTADSGYGLVQLPNAQSPDWNFTQLADYPHDITFDRVLFRETLFKTGTRQCLNIQGRNINITNSYFAGCVSRDQADGAISLGMSPGPMLVSNNYSEAISSGWGVGGGSHVHDFPMEGFDYWYIQSGCTAGCNGTMEYRYNYIYKPDWVRWKEWKPYSYVGIGTIWSPTSLGWVHIRVTTPGTTGSSEPAWNRAASATTNDGTAVWITEIGVTPEADSYGAKAFTAGRLFYAQPGGATWIVAVAGTATGSGLPMSPIQNGTLYSDGGTAQFRPTYNTWTAGAVYKRYDVIQSDYYANFRLQAQADCTSGTITPAWNSTEGEATTDGACTWVASRWHGIWPSKNLGDWKAGLNQWLHHNYYYNSWAQNAQGGGQGNLINFQCATGQGGVWNEIGHVTIENSVFDSAQNGIVLNGKESSYDGNIFYCNTMKDGVTPADVYTSDDPRCPANTYGLGNFHDMVIRNVRITNLNTVPNDHSPNSPSVIQAGNGIKNLTVDHSLLDGTNTSLAVITGFSNWPNSNMVITNNIMRTTSSFFRCDRPGSSWPCGTTNSSTVEGPALNFIGANIPFVPGAYWKHQYPNFSAAYSDSSKVAGNVFSGGTSSGSPLIPANSGSGTLPANNLFASWSNIRFDRNYRISASSQIHKAAADGKNPGPDPDQQPVLLNVRAVASDQNAVISFDMTPGSAVITPVLQVAATPDFDLAGPGWVLPSLDPSTHPPDANRNTILSADYEAYAQFGLSRAFSISGLTTETTYYYRIHGGGQMATGSFRTSSPLSGSRTAVVSVQVTDLTVGAAGAKDIVVEYGTTYTRSTGLITAGGATTPVTCTAGGGACSVTFTVPAGVPVYYRYKIRDASGNTLVTQPVQVTLPI